MLTSCRSGIRAPGLAVGAGRVDRDPADDFRVIALAFGKPEHDVEELLPLDHPGEGTAAHGDLHDRLDVRHVDPVAAHTHAGRSGFPDSAGRQYGTARDWRCPARRCKMLITRWPARSRTVQIVAKQLDRIRSLDAGKGFLHVVANQLREIDVDRREFLELLHQFVLDLFAGDLARPDADGPKS